jgi:hypothetical protein
MAETTKRELPVAFLAGAVIVALLVGGAILWSKHSAATESAAPPPLPMGAAEQAYASEIKFSEPNTPMSRASNFLNQEVTYIFGTVENDGPRTINQIEVTLEFHDVFNQVVLRDSQRLLPELTEVRFPIELRACARAMEHAVPHDSHHGPRSKIIS